MLEKYVVQAPGLGFSDLKMRFSNAGSSRKATVLSDVGILAVRDRCKESIGFLIENLEHENLDVCRVAIDYLGDLPPRHKVAADARRAIEKTIKKMRNEKGASRVHDFAVEALRKLERRMAL